MREIWQLLLIVFFLSASLSLFSTQYIGEIRWVGFNFAPSGWASCDGQVLSIADNTTLFAVVGATYGGDGETTFALPDMRGRTMLHAGQGPQLSQRILGDAGGAETHTLTISEMPTHSHDLKARAADGNQTTLIDNSISKTSGRFIPAAPNTNLHAATISSAGNNQPHENMPPFLTLHCIIALTGDFPPLP